MGQRLEKSTAHEEVVACMLVSSLVPTETAIMIRVERSTGKQVAIKVIYLEDV